MKRDKYDITVIYKDGTEKQDHTNSKKDCDDMVERYWNDTDVYDVLVSSI